MDLMNEETRKEIIATAKKYGGIGLRGQFLKQHSNGAKFTISKVYIDDGVINPDVRYTLVLIPEEKDALQSDLFHTSPVAKIIEEGMNDAQEILEEEKKSPQPPEKGESSRKRPRA